MAFEPDSREKPLLKPRDAKEEDDWYFGLSNIIEKEICATLPNGKNKRSDQSYTLLARIWS